MAGLKDLTASGTIGTVSYNGFTFPAIRSVKVEIAPHYDGANRARSYNVYTFTIEALLWNANEAAQSTAMDSLYVLLSTPGGALTISGCGLGTFAVSGVNGDVIWGPKPRPFKLNPLGGFIAHELLYTIEVALPACSGTTDYTAPLEFNYEITYAINDRGITTRTVSGYVRIPQTYTAAFSNTVTRTADSLRSVIAARIGQLDGFKRTQTYKESSDRNQLDFTIIDAQVDQDEPYPPGVVDADISFNVENMDMGFRKWTATLSGSLETAAGYPVDWGWQVFYMLARSRRDFMVMQSRQVNGENSSVLPTKVRYSRKLYSRKSSFSITFQIVTTWTNIAYQSGLWDPLPGGNSAAWRTSLSALWGPRGLAGLNNPMPAGDAIITLCNGGTGSFNSLQIGGASPTGQGGAQNAESLFSCQVTLQSSWLYFKNDVEAVREQEVSTQKAVQTFNLSAVPGTDVPGVRIGSEFTTGFHDTIEAQSIPTDHLVMWGKSMRVDFQPTIPALAITGVTLVELKRRVAINVLALIGSCPVYGATWEIHYRVVSGAIPSGPIPTGPNPALALTGNESAGNN